ncbi:MAG TPA: alpha/beta hydrolase [Acidimicrobiales bacterium]|nr:alpha/beta hydrolase [Acidimicrobiales bacterium]
MDYTRSRDGTQIAYDRSGSGPPVVLVASALADHRDARRLARHLSEHFTVLNYDRRGRGGSGDGSGVDVDREVEDVAALVEVAGGRASLFGSSSGAILALEAANVLREKVSRLALFDPPFNVDDGRPPLTEGDIRRLEQQLAAGQRGEAVKEFMTRQLGMPAAVVAVMRLLPTWSKLEKLAPSLVYDLQLLHRTQSGTPPPDRWAGASMPTLVLTGGKSDAFLQSGGRAVAQVLPAATHEPLPRASHSAVVAAPKRLAERLVDFLGANQ